MSDDHIWKLGDRAIFLSPETYPRCGFVYEIHENGRITIEISPGKYWTWNRYRFFTSEFLLKIIEEACE